MAEMVKDIVHGGADDQHPGCFAENTEQHSLISTFIGDPFVTRVMKILHSTYCDKDFFNRSIKMK